MFNPFETPSAEADTPFEFNSAEPEIINAVSAVSQSQPTPTTTAERPSYTKKYNIVDMYWLINQKLFNQEKLEQNEASLLIIGYNADFNNLRVAFHEAGPKTFTEASVLKYETKQITTVNIFSETAQKVLYNIQSKKYKDEISNFERIFTPHSGSNDWKPNPSQIEMEIPKYIKLRTKFNNTTYLFTFSDWQIQALLNAMKFMTDGNAWKASLNI
jgi:hypothetical protein